jgi:hypothetical protein
LMGKRWLKGETKHNNDTLDFSSLPRLRPNFSVRISPAWTVSIGRAGA